MTNILAAISKHRDTVRRARRCPRGQRTRAESAGRPCGWARRTRARHATLAPAEAIGWTSSFRVPDQDLLAISHIFCVVIAGVGGERTAADAAAAVRCGRLGTGAGAGAGASGRYLPATDLPLNGTRRGLAVAVPPVRSTPSSSVWCTAARSQLGAGRSQLLTMMDWLERRPRQLSTAGAGHSASWPPRCSVGWRAPKPLRTIWGEPCGPS